MPRPPRSPPFPYTTLFRSLPRGPLGIAHPLHEPGPLVLFHREKEDQPILGRHDRPRLQNARAQPRSEEHTSELQSRLHLVCRLLLEKKENEENTSDSVSD